MDIVERANEKALELLKHRHATAGYLMQDLAAEITRLRADLKVAGAESAALQAGLVDAIFQKKLVEGYKVDAAEIHAKAFVDWSLTQLRNELALIERDE